MPTIYREKTFDNFIAECEAQKKMLLLAKYFLAGKLQFLIFAGAAGIGKSHIGAAIANEINSAYIWMNYQSVIRTRIGDDFKDIFTPTRRIIIIDDLLIQWKPACKAEYNPLSRIIFHAYETGKQVYITTNLKLESLKKHLTPEEFADSPVIDRIKSTGKIMYFSGIESRRKRENNRELLSKTKSPQAKSEKSHKKK